MKNYVKQLGYMTTITDKLKRAKASIVSTATNVAGKANKISQTAITSLTDLNGDGKVDAEDLKIALEKAKSIGSEVAEQTGKLAKGATDHPMVKDAAAGALVGGAIASVIPLIGSATGAAVGAVIGVATGRNRTVIEVGQVPAVAAPKPKRPAAKKPAAKKPAAKKPAAKKPAAKKLTNA